MQRALTLRSARQELLSQNLANAATPNYHAVDLDFEASMRAAEQRPVAPLATTDPRHLPVLQESGGAPVQMARSTTGAGLDGNTVDVEEAMGTLSENTILYGATAQITAGVFANLIQAIREGK
jgi:flagellar basal-body rod protein FlgB